MPACTEADTPGRRLLLQAVCILPECILVASELLDYVKNQNCNTGYFQSKVRIQF